MYGDEMKTERTKFDWCFNDKVKEVGYWYYVNDLVHNVSKKGNVYSCNVDKYNTMLEFETNRKEDIDDLECTCSFYDNEDNFCPHVYALVCHIFNVSKEASSFDIDNLEKYKHVNVNKIKKEFDKGNLDIIDLDLLGYNYEELFPDRNNDPLLDKLDKYIESMPMEVLEKARKQDILEGEDTRILDKAIKNKITHQKQLEKKNKLERKRMRKVMFKGFLDGLFGGNDNQCSSNDELESWKKDYEPYNFEEEELEDDDYYYDDDNEE